MNHQIRKKTKKKSKNFKKLAKGFEANQNDKKMNDGQNEFIFLNLMMLNK